MTQKLSRGYSLSVVAALFVILTLLIAAAMLAQVPSAGQRSAQHAVVSAPQDGSAPGQAERPLTPWTESAGSFLVGRSQTKRNPLRFVPPVVFDSGGVFPWSIVVADVNGDGKPDLVVQNANSGIVGVLLGNGYGWFQPPMTYSSGKGDVVAVADVNRDGKPDLVVADGCGSNCSIGKVSVLLGNGDGTFQSAMSYPSGGVAKAVAVADVNGDGKPDILVANDTTMAVLLGKGDGTFQPPVTYSVGALAWCYSIAVADVNGDGHPDVIVADAYVNYLDGATVAVLLGNGGGIFQNAVNYYSGGAAGSYSSFVVVRDVNGDGKPDLLVANSSNTVGVLLGNGDGTFQAPIVLEPGWTYSIAVADLDGDGKPDLVVAGETIKVEKGNGDGTFQPPVTYHSGGGSFGVAVADVNGDGAADLLVTNVSSRYEGSLGVLLHSTQRTTTTSLVSTLNPSTYGQAVTFTAKMKSKHGTIPDGESVAFYDGLKMLGSGTLAGETATYTTSALSVGKHVIRATYVGDEKFEPSAGSVKQVVVE